VTRDSGGLRRVLRGATVVALAAAVVSLGRLPPADARFTATTSSTGSALAAKAIFSGETRTTAHRIVDSSSGTPATATDPFAVNGDGKTVTSKGTPTTFSATRYIDFVLDSGPAGGVPVSAVTASFSFSNGSSDNICVYLELRQSSTAAVLGASGSAASPSCSTSASRRITYTFPAGTLSSSTVYNDLTLRAYVRNASGFTRAIGLDEASVSGTLTTNRGATTTTVTLFPLRYDDRLDGVAASSPYIIAFAGDGAYAPSQFAIPASYSTSWYMGFELPLAGVGYLPSDSTVTAARLFHSWRPSSSLAAGSICYYARAYNGTTALGSNSAEVCNTGGTTVQNDVIALPAVTTPAIANALSVRLYYRTSAGSVGVYEDNVASGITYSAP
jgi:hypothetical protein